MTTTPRPLTIVSICLLARFPAPFPGNRREPSPNPHAEGTGRHEVGGTPHGSPTVPVPVGSGNRPPGTVSTPPENDHTVPRQPSPPASDHVLTARNHRAELRQPDTHPYRAPRDFT